MTSRSVTVVNALGLVAAMTLTTSRGMPRSVHLLMAALRKECGVMLSAFGVLSFKSFPRLNARPSAWFISRIGCPGFLVNTWPVMLSTSACSQKKRKV